MALRRSFVNSATERPLPRLVPATIARPRIADWLSRHAGAPVRLLAAPAGSGKTTAVAQYLLERPGAAYIAIREGSSVADVRAQIAQALGAEEARSYGDLVAILSERAPCELCIDDLDRAGEESLDDLNRLAFDAGHGIALVYTMRSRSAIDAHQLLARGLAVLLDGTNLAFDAAELTQLVEHLEIGHAAGDVDALLEATEGWPIVAAYVLRDCAESKRPLGGGYERWRATSARYFSAFLAGELGRSGDADGATFQRIAASGDAIALEAYEARGMFVRYGPDGFTPYRVAAQILGAPRRFAPAPVAACPLLKVRMFGRFEATIEGRPLAWIRRRDAQIVRYLLLKPGGSASRAELRERFWPDADAHLATQSLRTACSNIRKAIAAAAGADNVEQYFGSRGDIVLDLTHAVLDVKRFSAHVQEGDAAYARGKIEEAFTHYLAADALYGGELFGGEAPEPWYAARAELYRSLFRSMLERLADMYAEANEHARADEYRARLEHLDRERLGLSTVVQLPIRAAAASA